MKKFKLCAILAALLCAASLTVACNEKPTEADTSPESTAAATDTVAEEVTETGPDTEKETDAMTEAVTTEATTEPVTEPETECHILFEDHFDGDAVDTTKWRLCSAEDQNADSKNLALWDPTMVTTDGAGHLLLKSTWDSEAKAARSGAVSTKGLFEAGYGYYEASIKFPLVYARSNFFTVTAGDTAINVIESINGQNAATSYGHVLSDGANVQALDAIRSVFINIYDGRFHVFGVLRDAEGYTFYIDGKESGFVSTDAFAATPEAGYLSLFWSAPRENGAGRSESQYSTVAEMTVDYVRVYSSLPETLGKVEASQAQLVFSDDFDGKTMDNTKWTHCDEGVRNEYMYWTNEMTYVDGNGHLIIRIEYDQEKNMIRSGGAWTAYTFNYAYGYYEARLKLPDCYGAWGAFWMMIGDVWQESARDGVEIDIIESTIGGKLGHALHSNYGNLNSLGTPTITPVDSSDGQFHTFGVLRAETGYFFYIDGMLSAIVPAYRYEPCPIAGRMKLTSGAAEWSGACTPESIASLPAQMEVDYTRVWDAMPDFD